MSELDYLAEEYYQEQMIFQEAYSDKRKYNNSLSNKALVDTALKADKQRLNEVTKHFPAYDVAENYKYRPDALSPKQKTALANVLAWYQVTYWR